MNSIATMLPKKRVCEMGAAFMAFETWLKFAPRNNQVPTRTGRQARMARVKTLDRMVGDDLGSLRKMWWISDSLP